ncbi:dihydropteroate synthase [Actinomyces mediterranea]|uniref:dihydropteroate synthase n=1 Tax=Actinomyces mediterranea TaxID=1871028 RepID=UPI000970F187|nr:dihydropteroate synthase [Actinomyces mediterranea]
MHPLSPSAGAAPDEDRTLIMGILNVTPDSFSDGGRFKGADAAIRHAHDMIAEGADIIDVGGESTRPGSTRINEDEEWARIGIVVAELADAGVLVSVDTLHARTALRAAAAGAGIINDVSGGCWDGDMNAAVADTDCSYVIQHYRALPGMPGESFDYGPDLMAALSGRLRSQVGAALDAGVAPERIIIDPGLGFSLTNEQCWEILASLGKLKSLGYPVLIGASRKRFVAAQGADVDALTASITRQAAREGAWAVRVHEIAGNARAAREGR